MTSTMVPNSATAAQRRSLRIRAYWHGIAFFSAILAFMGVREAANYTGIPIRYGYAFHADTWLGLGLAPTLRLQQLRTPFLDWVAIATYMSFFVFPFVAAWVAFRRCQLHRYALALLLLFGSADLVHVLVPTAPPWLVAAHGTMPAVARVLEVRGSQISPAVYATGNATAGGNPVAAMPSVHVAWVTLAVLALDAPAILALGYGLLMALAVVYLGEHFAVDTLAGLLLAFLAFRLACRLTPQTAPDSCAAQVPSSAMRI
ncbi:MAG TPA: phosphatase PAP2 family protein [Gemmatimonadaceae bacterium]